MSKLHFFLLFHFEDLSETPKKVWWLGRPLKLWIEDLQLIQNKIIIKLNILNSETNGSLIINCLEIAM